MARLPDNLERSGFHSGEFVAYGGGLVWRVRHHASRGWYAAAQAGGRDAGRGYLYGRTLAAVAGAVAAYGGERVTSTPDPYVYTRPGVGGLLRRASDGAEVYFQPGDDVAEFELRALYASGDVNPAVAADYFS